MGGAVVRSGKLTAAGVLAIIAGALGILGGILSMAAVGVGYLGFGGIFGSLGTAIAVTFGIIGMIIGGLTIYGGYLALQKRKYTMAMVFGGILGILSSWILGLIALILIIQSKNEFDS